MSLNETPSGERIHIGFFGLRNAGKSSLVNAVTGQELSLVSDIAGTTTDPVQKAMELLPLGPVVIIDTPGTDDTGALGELRVKRAKDVLQKTDIAVLVTEAGRGLLPAERELEALIGERGIPCIIAENKTDLLAADRSGSADSADENTVRVSALTGEGVHELKEMLADLARAWAADRKVLIRDLLSPADLTVLVIPIDALHQTSSSYYVYTSFDEETGEYGGMSYWMDLHYCLTYNKHAGLRLIRRQHLRRLCYRRYGCQSCRL